MFKQYGIIASLLVAMSLVGFGGIQTYRLQTAKQTIGNMKLTQEAAKAKYTEQLLEQERVTNLRIAAIVEEHLQTQETANEQYEEVLGDLRADNLRLRDRFVCSQPDTRVTADPGRSAAEAPTGLLDEDVRFLVSEAKRADDVVRQLTLSQELLTIYKRHYDELRTRQK